MGLQRTRPPGRPHPVDGTVGDALDNAMIESFWARLQTELLNRKNWKTRLELTAALFDYL
jgi:putative transposase